MPLGNIRALANKATQVVNPNVSAVLFVSTGNTVNSSHIQVPAYTEFPVTAQVQPLSTKDIMHIDALNIQGAEKAVFLNGTALAIDRVKQLGGDLIVFPDGTLPEGNTWLIVASEEQWSVTWAKVFVKLQDDIITP